MKRMVGFIKKETVKLEVIIKRYENKLCSLSHTQHAYRKARAGIRITILQRLINMYITYHIQFHSLSVTQKR